MSMRPWGQALSMPDFFRGFKDITGTAGLFFERKSVDYPLRWMEAGYSVLTKAEDPALP